MPRRGFVFAAYYDPTSDLLNVLTCFPPDWGMCSEGLDDTFRFSLKLQRGRPGAERGQRGDKEGTQRGQSREPINNKADARSDSVHMA